MSTKKKRGVKASRIKLEEALAKSAVIPKKQIALANALADSEGLDAAPRDLINKLFREKPVDPQTIERVARILGVSAQSLYLENPNAPTLPSIDDSAKSDRRLEVHTQSLYLENPAIYLGDTEIYFEHPDTPTLPSVDVSQDPNSSKWWWVIFVLPVIILISLVIWNTSNTSVSSKQCIGFGDSNTHTSPQKLGVIISRFAGDPNNEVQIMLADAFLTNEKISKKIDVFTSCNRFNMSASRSYSQGFLEQRTLAQTDLRAVDAHILIWGERSQDQLNIRYTSLAENGTEIVIKTDQKSIQTNENYFSFPVKLTVSREIPTEVVKISLDFMEVETEIRAKTLSKLKSKFDSTGDWVRDAVISDRNLLRTISPKTDPILYALTGNQLCYRYRLLGDYEYNQAVYIEAEKACREVLENLPEEEFSPARAVVQVNLGSVLVRKHAFATTLLERYKILEEARKMFEGVEDEIKQGNSITTYTALNNNLSLTYLYLGAITGGEDSRAYLMEAKRRANLSLVSIDKVTQPKDYAITKQNLCLIGNRLADLMKNKKYVLQAINDCKEAVSGLSQHSNPQVWGMAQNNLAVGYALLADLSQDEHVFETAILEFSKAQENFTKERFPVNWAEVEINKAELNCRLAILKQDITFFDKSNKHGMLALPVFIEHNVATNIDYATRLLDTIKSCDTSDISSCKCSP
jgi:tetratricopeptide (TPR) repeat protein